jgi:RNA polymerase sigma factor (sigma-70 family)
MTPSLALSEAPVTPSVPAPPELPAVSTRPVVPELPVPDLQVSELQVPELPVPELQAPEPQSPELPVPPPAPVSRAARSIPGSVIRPPRPRLPRSRLRPGMRRRSGYRSSRKPSNTSAGRYCPSAKLASPARNAADQYLSRVDWCIRDLPDQAVLASQGFARLLDALRSGDSRALTIVIHQYSEWLRSAIRRAIHPRVRQRYDSVDFVQSTWASLILRRRRLPNIADADELARYLMRIAYHKVFDATRETLRTKKRDMRRECGLTDLEVGQTGRVAIRDRQQPRPSEVFRAREKLARMAKTLEEYPERMRDIHLRRVNGESLQQIAQTIGVHERTVRRILQRLLDESQRDP